MKDKIDCVFKKTESRITEYYALKNLLGDSDKRVQEKKESIYKCFEAEAEAYNKSSNEDFYKGLSQAKSFQEQQEQIEIYEKYKRSLERSLEVIKTFFNSDSSNKDRILDICKAIAKDYFDNLQQDIVKEKDYFEEHHLRYYSSISFDEDSEFFLNLCKKASEPINIFGLATFSSSDFNLTKYKKVPQFLETVKKCGKSIDNSELILTFIWIGVTVLCAIVSIVSFSKDWGITGGIFWFGVIWFLVYAIVAEFFLLDMVSEKIEKKTKKKIDKIME